MKNLNNSDQIFRKVLRQIFLSGLFILIFINLSAQSNGVDYSGTWGFNEAKSNLGDGGFRIAATTLVIAQKGNEMVIDRTQTSYEGEVIKTNEKYTLDGKECSNTGMMNSIRKSTVSWSEDKKTLTINTAITVDRDGEKLEMKSSEVMKISADSKVLTIESDFSSPWGDMKTTLVYDKK